MKVSIITVTYNSEKYLQDCIQSVKNQTYGNIQHIIVDGKSTDNTLKIIKKNEGSISRWISEPDRGMYDAINKGINLASGDIIGILNSDDILAGPNVIMDIVSHFEETGTDAVYGDLLYVDPTNINVVHRYWKGLPFKRNRFRYGWMPAHPTFYLRRELIQQFGGYKNHYYTAADYEFMARYLYRHHVNAAYLPELLVKMRSGGVSNTNIYARLRANRRDYLAMKQNRVPFALLVSILKPLIKIPQFNNKPPATLLTPKHITTIPTTSVLIIPKKKEVDSVA